MRIKTGNVRQKRKLLKSRPCIILKEWKGYIEEMDDHTVCLQMVDINEESDDRYSAVFRKSHFGIIELGLGMIFSIKVTSWREIIIKPVVHTEESLRQGKEQVNELISLLEHFRWEHDPVGESL